MSVVLLTSNGHGNNFRYSLFTIELVCDTSCKPLSSKIISDAYHFSSFAFLLHENLYLKANHFAN